MFRVLLIEDNSADVRLTREALMECNVPFDLRVANTGLEGIRILKEKDQANPIWVPDLILLDWNLPGLSGQEVLAIIKQDPEIRRIPVVVLTTSHAAVDISSAYDLHANCFISKPLSVSRFFDAIRSLEQFWLNTVTLPYIGQTGTERGRQ